jgi:hypothetical protein
MREEIVAYEHTYHASNKNPFRINMWVEDFAKGNNQILKFVSKTPNHQSGLPLIEELSTNLKDGGSIWMDERCSYVINYNPLL